MTIIAITKIILGIITLFSAIYTIIPFYKIIKNDSSEKNAKTFATRYTIFLGLIVTFILLMAQ